MLDVVRADIPTSLHPYILTMETTLIDSPVANVANIARALRAAGADLHVTRDPATIAAARKLVLPGGDRSGAERPRVRRAVPSREIVGRRTPGAEELHRMDVIPALDLLRGNAVRLEQGDFTRVTTYGDPETVLDSLDVPRGSRLHVVDLEASRSGKPIETDIVHRLARRDLRVQVGGGIRSVAGARAWIDCGAEKVVVGTVAADAPDVLRAIVE